MTLVCGMDRKEKTKEVAWINDAFTLAGTETRKGTDARCRIALAAVDYTIIGIEPHRPYRVCGQ